MKRMHINLAVENIDASVRFYTGLFGAPPTVLKLDYAKWMLDDPRVNFAISTRSQRGGLDHLGIQVESQEELAEVYGRLKAAEGPVLEQGEVTCCYATSAKSWVIDPQGVAWEAFLTLGEFTVYGDGSRERQTDPKAGAACCVPLPAAAACCSPASND